MRTITLHLLNNAHRCSAQHHSHAVGIVELSSAVSHIVEDIHMRLAFRFTQASTKLLDEHRKTLGWTKEQYRINLRNINTLVEHIHNKQVVDFLVLQPIVQDGSHLGIITC